jgi:hypothetical protein
MMSDKLTQLREAFWNRFKDDPYKGAGETQHLQIRVRQDENDLTKVLITVSRMYEYVPLNYQIMKIAADILETTNIDEGSRHHMNGCETCDHGSSYEWTLVCKDCKL